MFSQSAVEGNFKHTGTLVYQIQVPAGLNYFLLFSPRYRAHSVRHACYLSRNFLLGMIKSYLAQAFFQGHITQTTSIHEGIYSQQHFIVIY